MLASKYAKEHLRTFCPTSELIHRQIFIKDSFVWWRAVLKVPTDERRCSKGLKESSGLLEVGPAGPSKFAGLRREICLLTRSRVLGMTNVAFRIFLNSSRLASFARFRGLSYTALRRSRVFVARWQPWASRRWRWGHLALALLVIATTKKSVMESIDVDNNFKLSPDFYRCSFGRPLRWLTGRRLTLTRSYIPIRQSFINFTSRNNFISSRYYLNSEKRL